MADKYEQDLGKNAANYVPLSPLTFLRRSAAVYPNHQAVVHGNISYTYSEVYDRARKLGSALASKGIGKNDTVAVLATNVPAIYDAHFGVPMAGAVLNTINTRLDAATIAFILDHGDSKAVITDTELSPMMKEALTLCKAKPIVIDVDDASGPGGERLGSAEY